MPDLVESTEDMMQHVSRVEAIKPRERVKLHELTRKRRGQVSSRFISVNSPAFP